MQAFTRSVFDLFAQKRRYLVPMFQRPYVWGEEKQWEPLWEDIRAKADQHVRATEAVDPHFMGAIVINQLASFGPSLPSHEIIDGQQRLTTFQLMLAAFRDVANKFNEEDLLEDLNAHTINSGKKSSPEEEFKVWPTRADQMPFTHCLKSGSREALEARYPALLIRKKLQPRHKMVEAYLFFDQSLQQYLTEPSDKSAEDRFQAVFTTLQSSMQLVSIELETKDDPQIIFETLNARGEPLLSSDLLRNFVFRRAKREGLDTDNLYAKYWSFFDTMLDPALSGEVPLWKVEERQGRLMRPRLDLFIQHFLALKTKREVNVTRLFHDYRQWIETDRPYASVEDELKDLRHYSDPFAKFFHPSNKTALGKFLLRFQRMLDTNTIFPFLLYIEADSGFSELDKSKIFRDLESYLVRRIVCGLTEKAYNLLFLRLMRSLRDDSQSSAASFRRLLLELEAESHFWPNDNRFREAWLSQPIYKTAKSSARVEAMLRAIEEEAIQEKNEQIDILGPLTIEHVMPQEWEAHWPIPAQKDSLSVRAERETMIHTFGNLTLLTSKLNSSVQNGPFESKRPSIALQSKLWLNTYFQTALIWDEEAIRLRGEKLFAHAQRTWPFPSPEL